MRYRSLNLSRVGRAILIGISLLLLMNRNAWSQEAIAPNIQPYIDQLTDDNPSNDKEAIQKIREINDIDGLIIILNRGQLKSRQAAIKVLGEIGPSAKKAVQPLIKVLQDPQKDEKSRRLAAESLGEIASQAKAAVKPLIQELKTNPYQSIVFHSIHALMKISPTEPETVEALIYTLENYNDDQVRSRASSAIGFAIEKIESLERLNQTLVKLKELTKETNSWQVRLGVAQSLATSGRDVKLAVETLINLLQETDEEILKKSLESLTISLVNVLPRRAPNLTSQERKNAISGLETILNFFQDNQDNKDIFPTIYLEKINELEVSLNNTLKILKEIRKLDLIIEIIFRLIATYPKISIPLLALFLWFLSISFLLLIAPIQLLHIHKFLDDLGDLEFGEKIKIKLLSKLLFNIHYHPRVLDQWVKLKIDKVSQNFKDKPTVKDRESYIPRPVSIDREDISESEAKKHLQKKFVDESRWHIYGEGGSGKTSLACQIARWAMSDISEERLCKYQMLPILLENEEVFLGIVPREEADLKNKERSRDDDSIMKKVVLRVIRTLLSLSAGDKENFLTDELVEQLLRKRRLLVIIDGFSEMDTTITENITPQSADFPVNAVVLTSRPSYEIGRYKKIELKPIKEEELFMFMKSYLKNLKLDIFDDQELSKHCRQLSEMADNDITVMLAKLYADQMIAVKTNKISDNVPKNIPEVILYYLNGLNKNNKGLNKNNKEENALGDNDRIVRDDAKVVAWECIKQKYKPGRAIKEDVLAQLGGNEPEERLKDLEDHLGIIKTIKTIKPEGNEICYCLNLLAEYLAGLYLVETLYQDNEISWRDFLRKVDTLDQPNLSIGFLKALHKCCLASRDQVQIPEFLLNKLISIINDSDLDYS